MASILSLLDTLILRTTANPPLTNKAAVLTHGEWDGDWIKIYNAIQDIVNGVNVPAYDAAATYDLYSTDPKEKFALYNSRIWAAIYAGSPSNFSGQTPAEGTYWEQVSLAQMLGNPVALTKIAEAFDDTREAGAIYSAKLDIATADVLTLNSVPIEIVPAPGAGYALEVIDFSYKIVYNSATYATNTTLAVGCAGATVNQRTIASTGIARTASGHVNAFSAVNPTAAQTQVVENAALQVTVLAGDPTAGDGDITVYIAYRIITL